MSESSLVLKLLEYDAKRTFLVSLAEFEKALVSEGFIIGDTSSDAIVMQCKVTKSGMVSTCAGECN